MSDLLNRARAALEGVTPGPWETIHHPGETSYPSDRYHVITARTGDRVAEVDDESEDYEEPHAEFGRDAAFIAAARQLVPELTARLAALETVLAQVREAAEYWTSGVIGQPDKPAHHQALRQGGQYILGLIERACDDDSQ